MILPFWNRNNALKHQQNTAAGARCLCCCEMKFTVHRAYPPTSLLAFAKEAFFSDKQRKSAQGRRSLSCHSRVIGRSSSQHARVAVVAVVADAAAAAAGMVDASFMLEMQQSHRD